MLWNFVSDYFKDSCSFKQFHRKVQSDPKYLGNSDLLVHTHKKEKYILHCHTFAFKSDYPFDVFYAFLFVG